MSATADETRRALQKLLSAVAGPAYRKSEANEDLDRQIDNAIERVKAEASEGAALIAACAPHGKTLFARAQQKLDTLSGMKLLLQLAIEKFGEL